MNNSIIIKRHIDEYFDDSNVYFVFANSLSLNTWSDYAVKEDGGRVYDGERFITWRQFRKDYLLEHNETGKVIPDALRKLFVISILAENEKKSFLKRIVNPNYRKYWESSIDLVCQILPGLDEWKEKFEQKKLKPDDEDLDFFELYNRYSQYLKSHNLYEKAWCKIKLQPKDEKQKFIIFYPEQINDFSIRYAKYIENSPNVELVKQKQHVGNLEVEYYKDVRTEIRMTTLKIRKLLEEGTSINDIAILVPESDFDILKPYVHRELNLHGIPCTVSSTKPACSNSPASVFHQIEKCVENNFYFENLSAVLLNPHVGWKEKNTLENLVKIGKDNCCLLNTKDRDFWNDCLPEKSEEKKLYQEISSDMGAICKAESFYSLNEKINNFLVKYTEKNDCEPLKECLLKLSELVILERAYKMKTGVVKPFSIYNSFISTLTVPVHPEAGGVSMIKYIDGVDANFKNKFLISASQNSIGLTYTPLDFIRDEAKRLKLGLETNDSFARDLLSICACSENIEFSCAEETFGGFGVPYIGFDIIVEGSELKERTKEYCKYEFDLLESQQSTYENYQNIKDRENKELSKETKDAIDAYIKNTKKLNGNPAKEGYSLISQTDLAAFFPCPRKWIMQRFFSIKQQDADASLLNIWDAGTINHRIIELFFEQDIGTGNELFFSDYMESHKVGIIKQLTEHAETAIGELTDNDNQTKKGLSKECLISQKKAFASQIFDFLKFLFDDIYSADSTSSEKWCYGKSEVYRDLDCDEKQYKVFGKLDLLLYKKTDPGRYAIIDFKNGSLATHTPATNSVDEDNKIKDFQCAVYVLIQKDKLLNNTVDSNNPQLEKMSFYSIKGQEKKNIVVSKAISRSTAKMQSEYKPTLQQLIKYCEIFAQHTNLNPNGKDKDDLNYVDLDDDCRECQFKAMCRTTFTIGGVSL